jgi:hypothetical protein
MPSDVLPQTHELPAKAVGSRPAGVAAAPAGRHRAAHPGSGSAPRSRPYAKFLAGSGICSHFADGDPDDLRRAGYAGDRRTSAAARRAIRSHRCSGHLFFQSEKPCGGYCHYANIMSTKMKYVGIGVWVANGRVRLVVDFWEG